MWDWTETQITLVLIRHGATRSNQEHRYLGKTDEVLSNEGKASLLENQKTQIYPEITHLLVSPMKRCVETARLLYPDMKMVQIKEWAEMDFGEFEGKNYLDLKEYNRYQKWINSNGTLPFPGGESRDKFILRCNQGFQKMIEILQNLPEEPEVVGMVVHGGTIMALLSSLCGGAYFDYQVKNGRGYICRLQIENEKWKMIELKKI